MSDRRAGALSGALRTPTGLSAAVVLAGLILLAVIGPLVWGGEAKQVDIPRLLEGHSADHLIGTDNLGRDLFARTLVATRLSLILAFLAVVVGAGIGITLGALPSVLGRRGGRIISTVIDFALAFPGILLLLFLAIILGVGAHAAVLAIGLAFAPGFARLTQTLAASAAGSDYLAAARVLGLSRRRLLLRHVLPNIAEPIILQVTLAVGAALLTFSGLSFIGLGVQPPDYDWGLLLNQGLARIYVAPEASLGPAAAIVIAGLAFNGLGEALARAASTRPLAARRRRPGSALIDGDEAAEAPSGSARRPDDVLNVEGLTVTFPTPHGEVVPVRDLTLSVRPGEVVGIVGESGSGKSLTALAIAQLVPYPGQVVAERLEFLGTDVRTLPESSRRRLLGTSLSMVFQDPATSMNPALRLGRQLAEVAEVHGGLGRSQAMRHAVDRLRRVRISGPERRVHQYPHELSGGMRQRAMIAMGLMGEPKLIIADEPTSALDVTVQQQILRLLRQVSDDTGAAAIVITHDIAVVTELCSRVLVMYAGRVVEDLDIATLLTAPAHPYTRKLLASIPDMATDLEQPLSTISGRPPEVHEIPDGCPFAPRCDFAGPRCTQERPPLDSVDQRGRLVACWHPQHEAPPTPADDQEAVHS